MDASLVVVSRDQLLSRIRGEYTEMPGLRLTRAQAQRLWGLDEQICLQLLESLTEDRFLYRGHDGTYARSPDVVGVFPSPRMAKVERAEGTLTASNPSRAEQRFRA
jgi:hypothetical protein